MVKKTRELFKDILSKGPGGWGDGSSGWRKTQAVKEEKMMGEERAHSRYGSGGGEGILAWMGFLRGGRVGGMWPKKSKTKTHLTVDPCITNRAMCD